MKKWEGLKLLTQEWGEWYLKWHVVSMKLFSERWFIGLNNAGFLMVRYFFKNTERTIYMVGLSVDPLQSYNLIHNEKWWNSYEFIISTCNFFIYFKYLKTRLPYSVLRLFLKVTLVTEIFLKSVICDNFGSHSNYLRCREQGWGRLRSLITITILITGHGKLLITITIMIIW
jgi:hypothetical protein